MLDQDDLRGSLDRSFDRRQAQQDRTAQDRGLEGALVVTRSGPVRVGAATSGAGAGMAFAEDSLADDVISSETLDEVRGNGTPPGRAGSGVVGSSDTASRVTRAELEQARVRENDLQQKLNAALARQAELQQLLTAAQQRSGSGDGLGSLEARQTERQVRQLETELQVTRDQLRVSDDMLKAAREDSAKARKEQLGQISSLQAEHRVSVQQLLDEMKDTRLKHTETVRNLMNEHAASQKSLTASLQEARNSTQADIRAAEQRAVSAAAARDDLARKVDTLKVSSSAWLYD